MVWGVGSGKGSERGSLSRALKDELKLRENGRKEQSGIFQAEESLCSETQRKTVYVDSVYTTEVGRSRKILV